MAEQEAPGICLRLDNTYTDIICLEKLFETLESIEGFRLPEETLENKTAVNFSQF